MTPILVLFSQVKSHQCNSLPFAEVHRNVTGISYSWMAILCVLLFFNFTKMDYFRCYRFYILKQEAGLSPNEKL